MSAILKHSFAFTLVLALGCDTDELDNINDEQVDAESSPSLRSN